MTTTTQGGALVRAVRAMFCRHDRNAWSITYACGCRYEWCRCDAHRRQICSEHAAFLGYTQETVGRWPA